MQELLFESVTGFAMIAAILDNDKRISGGWYDGAQ